MDDKILVVIGLIVIGLSVILLDMSDAAEIIDKIITILGSLAVGGALGSKKISLPKQPKQPKEEEKT